MKIGIYFGDNDFHNTFQGFFTNIIQNLDFEPTKEQIVELFNESAFSCYLAFQNCFQYKNDGRYHLKHTYLKIGSEKVFLGNEVDKFREENANNMNSEFFCYEDGYFWSE